MRAFKAKFLASPKESQLARQQLSAFQPVNLYRQPFSLRVDNCALLTQRTIEDCFPDVAATCRNVRSLLSAFVLMDGTLTAHCSLTDSPGAAW